jgi:hypothetical protein
MKMELPRRRVSLAAGGVGLVALGALVVALAPRAAHEPAGHLAAAHLAAAPAASALREKDGVATKWANARTVDVFEPEGDDEYATYRAPAIVSLGGTVLLAFAEAYRSADTASAAQPVDIVVKRSDDRGLSWSPSFHVVVGNQLGLSGGDARARGRTAYSKPTPIAVAPAPGGRPSVLLLFAVNETLLYETRSRDGRDWTPPRDLSAGVKLAGWGRVVPGPGHGLQLAHGPAAGRLLAPFAHSLLTASVVQTQTWRADPTDARAPAQVETAYAVENAAAREERSAGRSSHAPLHLSPQRIEGRLFDDPGGSGGAGGAGGRAGGAACYGLQAAEAFARHVGVLYSDDGGENWHVGASLPAVGAQHLALAQLPSGELVAIARARAPTAAARAAAADGGGAGCAQLASSLDGGITWALRAPAADGGCALANPAVDGALGAQGVWLFALGQHGAAAAAAGAAADASARAQLGVYASPDGGERWALVGRPAGSSLSGASDLTSWAASGIDPWPEVGALYEHGRGLATTISFTRAQLGDE